MSDHADPVVTKLSAARTRLILDKPFLGTLVLRLPLVAADPSWCKTSATDARHFYYNAEYIGALSLDQVQFVLAHEALHCALSHFARRQSRDRKRWDLACDLAINPLLVDEGLIPTPEALLLDCYKGMTAEEIYPCLDEDSELEPQDHHVYDQDGGGQGGSAGSGGEQQSEQKGGGSQQSDQQGERGGRREPQPSQQPSPERQQGGGGGAEQPPPLTAEERESLSVQWRQRMAGAAQQAMQAGKMGGELGRMIDHLLQPQLPWRMLLARYFNSSARDDYNYLRPARREGEAIMPGLRSHAIEAVIALDTSGSISDEEMAEFLAEVNALKGSVNARVTLVACDEQLAADGPWEFEPWQPFELPENFDGGGGTDFRPVFDWLEQEQRRADLLVYFTDAEGHFPTQPPPLPVVWLVKGRAKVPWGERIQLN